MSSIVANTTGRVHQTTGITTGAFSAGMWWRLGTFTDGDVWAVMNNAQSQGAGYYRATQTAQQRVRGYAFGTGSDNDLIIDSAYAGAWLFLGMTHAAGSNQYKLYYRFDTVPTLSTQTMTVTSAITAEEVGFFDAYGASTGDGQGRSGFFRTDELSAADMQTASDSLSPPSGTNLIAYAFDVAATANDNIGTGADGTLTATFTDDADEPDMPVAPTAATPAPRAPLFFGSFP